ncbi:MAG: thioredoxin domain-containing protein [Patescibacteria group bacterium]
MDQKPNPLLTLPSAIIIAGTIIAIAIIWVRKPTTTTPITSNTPKVEISLAPVTSADHILGNPNASIKIVEFSDTSCPFCKTFHPTMKSIIDTYGPGGKVAWVYRNFPLDKPNAQGQVLHPNAGREAQALECAAALGGNDAFWKFTGRLYEITPSDQGKSLDQKELPNIAKFAGLDAVGFNECLSSERFKDKVEKQYMDGVNAGVSGTPTNIFVLSNPAPKNMDGIVADMILQLRVPIMISDDRMKIFMSGALPESAIKGVIEGILAGGK